MRLTLLPFVPLLLAMPVASAKADAYTFSPLIVPAAASTSVFGTIAFGINNVGQVVGSYGTDNGGFNTEQGFVLDLATGVATTVTSRDTSSALLAGKINDTGQITGNFAVGSGFQTTKGGPFLLDSVGGSLAPVLYPLYPSNFNVAGINNTGQILGNLTGGGSARSGPFYSQGYLRDLSTAATIVFADPLAPHYTVAAGFNDHGQVVGYFQIGSNPSGFLFDVATGSYTTLNDPLAVDRAPLSLDGTYAQSINNVGQIGGYFVSVSGVRQFGADFYNTYAASGFVLDMATGVYTTVNYPGATDTYVESINDAGQIVGWYSGQGSPQSFIATPTVAAVPEPASAALLGSGMLFLGWMKFRRRLPDGSGRRAETL